MGAQRLFAGINPLSYVKELSIGPTVNVQGAAGWVMARNGSELRTEIPREYALFSENAVDNAAAQIVNGRGLLGDGLLARAAARSS